jgi:hypothetical protein
VSLVKRAARQQQGQQQLAALLDAAAGPWPAAQAAAFVALAVRRVEYERADRPDLRSEVLPELQRLQGLAAGAVLASGALPQEPPGHLQCPITYALMEDPVVAADGHTYERKAIKRWLQKHSTSPLTNLRLEHKVLVPNFAIRSALEEWQVRHA